MGGEDPPCRATAAPPTGMAEGYRQQQKRPPPDTQAWGAGGEGEVTASAIQASQ